MPRSRRCGGRARRLEGEEEGQEESLKPKIEAIEARRRPNPGRIAGVVNVSSEPVEIPILVRGNYSSRAARSGRASRVS